MKAFVTGSTGLLGSNLIDALTRSGAEVKALVRSKSKGAKVLGRAAVGGNVTLVEGDMLDIDAFADDMRGSDVLFHAAAYFREYYGRGDHWDMLDKVNVKGTIKLFEAAERAGIKRVIYVSSGGIIGAGKRGQVMDESTPPDKAVMENLYFKSKVLAEQAIFDWQKTHKLHIVHILPGWIFGPSDSAPTASGQVVLDFLAGKLPAILPGANTIVDARDVAEAMLSAVERGRDGERYLVAGNHHTIEDVALTLAKVSGLPAPTLRIPYLGALMFATVSEWWAGLRNTETVLTVAGFKSLQNPSTLSNAKAIRELGVSFRTLETTLRDAVTWYREQGFAPAQGVPAKSSSAANSPAR
jgi:dihydroflavonol-4-reductase